MNTLFIVNPAAGRGKCFRKWTQLEDLLHERASFAFAVRLTRKSGDAENFAITAIQEGFERIVSVGGDGTVNEIINGVAGSNVQIGILPFGTGNDLALALRLSTDYMHIVKMLESPTIKLIDIVKINERFYINAAGLGIDGQVVQNINQHPMINRLGKIGYIVSALQSVLQFRPDKLLVTIDGHDSVLSNVWILAITNGPYFGGGMKVCPKADLSDGWLDLCIVQNLSKWQFFRLFPLVFSGQHVRKEQYVTTLRAKKVHIDIPNHLIMQSDGEIMKFTSVTIEIIPHGIQMMT